MAINYTQYREAQIKAGGLYQDFVMEMCARHANLIIQVYGSKEFQWNVGESRQGVEIKFDDKYAATGNLWIEVAEKAEPRAGDYVRSGIYRTDNTWLFIIGNYDVIFVFPKNILQMLHATKRYREIENSYKTSVGFLLPGKDAEKYACLVMRPKCAEQIAKVVKDTVTLARELQSILSADERQAALFSY